MGHRAWLWDVRRLAAVVATVVAVTAVAAFIPSVASGVSAPYPHAPGDPNGDADIDAGDITQIELCILYPETYPNASYAGWDANEDGEGPNSGDILTTEYMIVGTWPFNHVHIEAPGELQYCTNFTATVHVTRVEDFGSAAYEITYDAGVLEVKDVTGGQLMQKLNGGSAQFYSVDVDNWGLPGGEGTLRVSNAIAGGQGATGAGYLSMIHFHVVGSACDSSGITFNETACNMSDDMGGAIAATWEGDSLHVAPEPTPSPSPTTTPSPSPTVSPTPTPSPSASPSPTPTASPTVSASPTPSPSATYTTLPTPTVTLTALASPTPSATAGGGVTVYIDAPAEVTAGTNFIASVNVTEVYHLAAADYDIVYDPSVLEVVDRNGDSDINNLDIIAGKVGGKGFPVKGATLVGGVQGKLRVLQYLKAGAYRDGEGYLCKVEFKLVGSACDTSAITPQEIEETGSGLMKSDTTKIPATWVSDSVHGQ